MTADEARSRKTARVNDDKPSAPKTTNTNRLANPTPQPKRSSPATNAQSSKETNNPFSTPHAPIQYTETKWQAGHRPRKEILARDSAPCSPRRTTLGSLSSPRSVRPRLAVVVYGPACWRMGVRRCGWAADWVERARCKGSNEVGLTMHSHDARCRWRALATSNRQCNVSSRLLRSSKSRCWMVSRQASTRDARYAEVRTRG